MSKTKIGQKSPRKSSSIAEVKGKSSAKVPRARIHRGSAPPKISRAWEGSSPTAAAQSDSGVFSQSQTIMEPLPRLSFDATFDEDPGFCHTEREMRKAASVFKKNNGSGPREDTPDDSAMNEIISDSQKEVNNSSETEPDTPTQRPRQPLASNANDTGVPMSVAPELNNSMPLDSADSLLDSLARCIDALTASREEELGRCERLCAQMNRFRLARTKEKKKAREIQESLMRIQGMLEKERSKLVALAADIEFN
ncbi:hypothetical protein BDN70DRAFT_995049 [Pholiota conissans]|uniref:Uncharacterized protein n=1 Tax=Pholiota conissans TaxID=109636 RepID=A0A9P5YX61_9AGAR|nr:hypothetical protein BDN70DRAFT_995049 [Pholiota conissans]